MECGYGEEGRRVVIRPNFVLASRAISLAEQMCAWARLDCGESVWKFLYLLCSHQSFHSFLLHTKTSPFTRTVLPASLHWNETNWGVCYSHPDPNISLLLPTAPSEYLIFPSMHPERRSQEGLTGWKISSFVFARPPDRRTREGTDVER